MTVREILLAKKKVREELLQIPKEKLLSTGYTPLDVHCSGRTEGGYGKGLFVFIVGDNSTGKTWLSNTCLAEAARNPEFDDYEFIFDNVENGNLINTRKFFGRAVDKRLVPPRGTKQDPINSITSEDFFDNLYTRLVSKRPCIYIVDSETALNAEADMQRFQENKKLREAGKKVKGSYGMAKPKQNSDKIKLMIPLLEKTGSILIMIGQTRKNIDPFSFEDRTHSGGLSMGFYAHLEFWTRLLKKIKKDVRGKPRHIGTNVEVEIRKNRLTGWTGKLSFPFYKSFGIDELGGCIDYLVGENWWPKKGGKIDAKELEIKLKKEELVQYIQEEGLQQALKLAVKKCFLAIQKACSINREPRYT